MSNPYSIMFARFPFGASDHPDVTDWMIETVVKCKLDPRVDRVANFWVNDTPITLGRNRAVEAAKADKCHYLAMVDNDMKPDAYLGSNRNRLDTDSSALPFWDSSWEFMLRRRDLGPCMIGAPYCGPPPHENAYVFRWANFQSDHPNADLRIEQYTREEVAIRSGFEEVACLPTGLVIIDMRVFDDPLVAPPYFTYEYTDKFEQKKASTEDCVFTRDLNMANIPLYVNWDAWAGHWKKKCVGRPKPIFREQVHKKFVEAALNAPSNKRKLVFVQEGDGDGEVRAEGGSDYDASSRLQTGGPEGEHSGPGTGDIKLIEVADGNFTAGTYLPQRVARIGLLHGGPVAGSGSSA